MLDGVRLTSKEQPRCVQDVARNMNDSIMMVRFDTGDLVAAEAKYHRSCNRAYHNIYRSFVRKNVNHEAKEEKLLEERAFLELVDSIKTDTANGVGPMSDLTKMFDD